MSPEQALHESRWLPAGMKTSIEKLASLGYALIPTNPDLPEVIAAIEEGAKATASASDWAQYSEEYRNRVRTDARAAFVAIIKELTK